MDCHAAPSLQRDELLLVRRSPCLPRRLRGTRFGRLNPRLPSHTFKFEIRKTVVARESFLSESFQIFFPNPPFAGFNQLCCSGQQRRQSNATRYANPPRQSSESGRTFSECLHVTRSRPPAMYQLRARSAYKPVWADAGRRAAVARRRHVGAAAHVQPHCTGAVSPRRLCRGPTYSAASLGSHEEPRAFDPKIPDHAGASRRLLAARHRSLSTSRRLTPGWPSVCLLRSQPPRTPRPRWLHTFVRIAMSRCMRCPTFLPSRPQSPSTLAPGRPNGSA